MNTLATTVLTNIQRSPGRWTVNGLADATGRSHQAITVEIVMLVEQGIIERPAPIDVFNAAEGWQTVTFTPTEKGWVPPCKR